MAEFGFEFSTPFPNDEAQRGNRVSHGRRCNNQLSGDFNLLIGRNRNQLAWQSTAIQPRKDTQELVDRGECVVG